MTQGEKELLFKDLSARLPYGVKVTWDDKYSLTVTPHMYCSIASEYISLPKLLLRPMSSMTEEERLLFYQNTLQYNEETGYSEYTYESIDWLNAHHFDYRGLIEKGLAVEAPANMYKTE